MKGHHKIIVADRQSVTDLAIQEYGCYEGVFVLLKDTPTLKLHDVPAPGTELLILDEVPKLTPTNRAIAAQFKTQKKTIVGPTVPVETDDTGYVVTGYWDPEYTLTAIH